MGSRNSLDTRHSPARIEKPKTDDIMTLKITNQSCTVQGNLSSEEINLDRLRSNFILKRKIRGLAGRKKLGSLWLVLHPVFYSLVYFFVLSVVRSSPNSVNIFIGISMFNIFSTSLKSGINSVGDFTGGIKGERVRTSVISHSLLQYRVVDILLQSSAVSALLLLFLGIDIIGVLSYIVLCLIIGITAELFALNFSLVVRRIPDLSNFIDYFVMLMFFGSPVLYPLSITEGLHYRINTYNPFTFFVEASREVAGIENTLSGFFGLEQAVLLSIIFLLGIRGYFTLDKLRWEVSSWS